MDDYGNWAQLDLLGHIPEYYSVNMPQNGSKYIDLQFTVRDFFGREHTEYGSASWL